MTKPPRSVLTQCKDIHLITPPSSFKAIEAALSQNPHLTSLPLPKPDILAPESLTQTSGTAEILRHPDVKAVVTGDFLVLPCDLICEIPGESLLEAWMIQESGLGGASASSLDYLGPKMGLGGEKGGRRGGLGVWFQTRTESSIKGAETDFVITTALPRPTVPPSEGSLRPHISKLLYATTTDTLRDITAEKKSFPIRHGLIRKHGRIRMLTTHRDAHIYVFPHWVLDLVAHNESFDSISEDVVGWWAKASWQDGLAEKLGMRQIFDGTLSPSPDEKDGVDSTSHHSGLIEDDINLASMSTTHTSSLRPTTQPTSHPLSPIPPILAYIHPSPPLPTLAPLLLRVDTPSLLLSTSLHLATHPAGTTPHSHPQKISTPSLIAPHTSVHAPSSLLAANVTVATHASVKECVIGASCSIGPGAKLVRCLLMDEVEVGEKCVLSGCVLGRRSRVGAGATLRDVEVQGGFVVEAGADAKGEKMMVFDGLEDDEGDGREEGEGDGHGDGDGEDGGDGGERKSDEGFGWGS